MGKILAVEAEFEYDHMDRKQEPVTVAVPAAPRNRIRLKIDWFEKKGGGSMFFNIRPATERLLVGFLFLRMTI